MSGGQCSAESNAKRMVIVVDDDPRVRQSLEGLLSSAGFRIQLFGSPAEVLASGALERASCLITDIRMPGIDGWELQRRTAALYPQLPLIFVTAHHDDAAPEEALACGAFAFFNKPFDGEELLRTVAAALDVDRDHGAPDEMSL
jgi:FixJ family two-component response regulator